MNKTITLKEFTQVLIQVIGKEAKSVADKFPTKIQKVGKISKQTCEVGKSIADFVVTNFKAGWNK